MKIQYTNIFEKYGCKFEGNLAVVDYSKRADEILAPQPLGGFGRGATLDAVDEAKQLLKEKHPNFLVLLGVPVLVARIEEEVL